MKVLAFTVSHDRPYFLRHCVAQMSAQAHPEFLHSVSVTDSAVSQRIISRDDYLRVLFPDVDSGRTRFSFHPNRNQHQNYLSAITSVPEYRDYDLFIKIDDDDVYKNDYVSRCVAFHDRTRCDISSTPTTGQINGHRLISGKYQNLGGNPSGTGFCMPQTFAFNRKALDVILKLDPDAYPGWEDEAWRCAWAEQGLVHAARPDAEAFLWHIHGRNVSVAGMLQSTAGPLPNRIVYRAFDCAHADWIGTVFLYNDGTFSVTTNGDRGNWVFVDKVVLELTWERWPKERLFFDEKQGNYSCAEKSFVAADVTPGRRQESRTQPQPQVAAGSASEAG